MQQAATIAAAHLSLASMPEPHPRKRSKRKVVYHLLGKTGWSTVVVNGARQIPNGNFQWDAACSISTTFSRKIGSKTIQAKRPGTSKS